VKPTPGPIPVWVSADFLEKQKVQAWSDMPVWIPASGEYTGFADASVVRALREGLSIRPVQPTVNDTLAWYLQRPEPERAKLSAGLTPEREQAILEAWRAAPGTAH
jgi:2'-hydroxyisoflavone reductase